MFKELEDIIKNIKGNVLVIELENKLLDLFDKNNKINLYSISSSKNKKSNSIFSKNKKITNRGKTINIKKLRKYINKKSTDYIICNMNEMINYYKYFIKDSIYLNNKEIYLYMNKEIDKDFIVKKYNRYSVSITVKEYKTGYIIKIDNTKGKNRFFKDKMYFIKDTLYNIAETIGNILIN